MIARFTTGFLIIKAIFVCLFLLQVPPFNVDNIKATVSEVK
ncbi:MAG: hypothetical protein ACR2QF_01265 [Geminicoccaceae bacterium]